MASSISPLSYLSAYQSLPASSSASASGANASAPTGVSATVELQALEQQGSLNEFLNDSLAAAILQPASSVNSGTAASTLVNNMLQQVLGAYQSGCRTGLPACPSTSTWCRRLWGRHSACGGLPARLPAFEEMLLGGLRGRRSQSGCPTGLAGPLWRAFLAVGEFARHGQAGRPVLQHFLGRRDHRFRSEAELLLQVLERRRRAERVHADACAVGPT